jgi:isopropylmalate/homocitrate/citramalate synthase
VEDGDELNQVFARFKELADKKKTVTDADLEALIADEFTSRKKSSAGGYSGDLWARWGCQRPRSK